jgi:hypothetical protein
MTSSEEVYLGREGLSNSMYSSSLFNVVGYSIEVS